jgi:hypothetical protein
MTDLLELAGQALVDVSAVEMTTDSESVVEIWTISRTGSLVRASAPRLAVREGMQLECRLPVNGQPHRITASIESAEVQSQSRAALLLRVLHATPDAYHRQSHRLPVSLTASLTALTCARVVPGEVLPIQIVDLSVGGFGASITDDRPRVEDLYRLVVRFFEGTVDCEVRVRVARRGARGGEQVLGCSFCDLSEANADAVRRVLARLVG